MKYWAYINNEILGPYDKEKLPELPVFSASTLLCPQTPVGEKTGEWKEASTYPEIAELLKTSGKPDPSTEAQPPAEKKDAAGGDGGAAKGNEAPQQTDPGLSTSRRLSSLAKSVDPAPPESQPINPLFETNRLGPAAGEPKKDEPSYSPNFDPLTISQIGKRAVPPQTESPKSPSASGQPPEIFVPPSGRPPAQEEPGRAEPASQPEERTESAPQAAQPENAAPPSQAGPFISGEDRKIIDDINAKLDAANRSCATKEDIGLLKERMGQMNELIASMKENRFQQEILEKVERLERSISEIKESMAQRSAPPPQTVQLERNSDGFDSVPFQPKEEPLGAAEPKPHKGPEQPRQPKEPQQPKKGTETVIVDQGSKGKPSRTAAMVKRTFKLLFVAAGLASILFGTVFSLKYFGGPDLTRLLPFMPEFLAGSGAEMPSPPPFQEEGADGSAEQATDPAGADKKDISPEIVYFGRQYALKPGGPILENKIHEDAVFKKGNFNKLDWRARELPEGKFELTANIPLLDNSGQLVYRYEVDYANKAIKALDSMSQKPLDALQPPKRASRTVSKGRASAKAGTAKRGTVRTAPPKPAAQAAAPEEEYDDEEYEYVYEE